MRIMWDKYYMRRINIKLLDKLYKLDVKIFEDNKELQGKYS